jgi:hypothetical protein
MPGYLRTPRSSIPGFRLCIVLRRAGCTSHLLTSTPRSEWQEMSNEKTTDTISMTIPLPPERIPLSALEELIGAMIKATEEIFAYVEMWEQRKGLPLGEVGELRTSQG